MKDDPKEKTEAEKRRERLKLMGIARIIHNGSANRHARRKRARMTRNGPSGGSPRTPSAA